MFHLTAGMRIVARNTISTFLHVDVEKVQIIFAIPEIRQGVGELILGYLLVMAAETKIIIFRAIFLIELLGIITHQNPAVLGPVHLMTGHAITGLDRTMLIVAAGDIIAEFIMAAEAQFGRGVFQQGLLVGGMGAMTLRAFTLINRGMLVNRCFNIAVHSRTQFLMTTGAESAAFLV